MTDKIHYGGVFIAVVTFILTSPLWLLYAPYYYAVKIMVTIYQPTLLKRANDEWNQRYQENLRKGIYIDYPPTVATISGIGPWKHRSNEDDEDEEDEYEVTY